MSADIVNLNKVRKARERAEKEKRAEANRIKYGMSKAERAAIENDAERSKARLDGAKREMPPTPAGGGDDIDPGSAS